MPAGFTASSKSRMIAGPLYKAFLPAPAGARMPAAHRGA
jgi:hypothetical protein